MTRELDELRLGIIKRYALGCAASAGILCGLLGWQVGRVTAKPIPTLCSDPRQPLAIVELTDGILCIYEVPRKSRRMTEKTVRIPRGASSEGLASPAQTMHNSPIESSTERPQTND